MDTNRCPKCKTPIDWRKKPTQCPQCDRDLSDLIEERVRLAEAELIEAKAARKEMTAKKKAEDKARRRTISLEIPFELDEKLEAEMERQDKFKYEILTEALELYFESLPKKK